MNYNKLKTLRAETGVSFTLCKKALLETKNDLVKAKKLLTEWGAEMLLKKSGKTTLQGAIFSYVHHNKKVASLVELMCETDFVAKNEGFLSLGQELAMQLASMETNNIDSFLKQVYIRDQSKVVGDLLKEAVLKFGESIKIRRIERWTLGM